MDVLRKIEEYAACQSERIAFRSRAGEISYGELWEKSGILASVIENLMFGSKNPVIVYGHKDPMMIVCFIACVRSGRAYCPVDINTPAERIAQIIEKIGEPLVLMTEKTSAASEVEKREVFADSKWVIGYETIRELTQRGKITTALDRCIDEDDFYIIFTSGTTGTPKGVRITANNLNNYLDWAISLAGGIEEQSVFMNQAPYLFDLSVEKNLDSRKVILLVSPTWFKKDGVATVNYGLRFSESQYIEFMQNQNIQCDIKKYVAERSEKLLAGNNKFKTKVGIINRYLVDGRKDIISTILFKAEKLLAFDKDRVSAAIAVKRISKKDKLEFSSDAVSNEAFDLMFGQAEEDSLKESDNPFDISDKSWKRRFSKTYHTDKNVHPGRICSNSPEFDDMKAFLEICRQTGLQTKLIIMPVNGKWFDYVGTGEQQRRETTDRILKLAEKYGAETADLTVYEYEPFITKDVTHPWNKGWALIDREIYNFCTGGRKGAD